MKRTQKSIYSVLLALASVLPFSAVNAGNNERVAQAGAGELLINPWARSSGWASANTGSIRGLEAVFSNVAGIAFTKKTELIFSRTAWLQGSGININSFGFSQRVGETSVLALSAMSMSFGDIDITTVERPEGGIGTFSPSYTNIAISYAKEFSHSIYGGFTVRGISESIPDLSAQGVSLDAGIQYIAGKYDNIKFGISLKNVGPTMKFSGDGLSDKMIRTGNGTSATGTYSLTIHHKSEVFELPSLFNIGGAYDYKINDMHMITGALNFTSHSFTKDQFAAGVEYAFRNLFMVRAGYTFSQKDEISDKLTNAFAGPSAGFTVEMPFGKAGRSFGLDYSYRHTDYFQGTHSIGARMAL
jgi:hypothetical protein